MVAITDLANKGIVDVKFTDIRDAQRAVGILPQFQPQWTVHFINSKEFMRSFRPRKITSTSDFEGQVMVTAHCSSPKEAFNSESIAIIVKDLLQEYGDIMAYDTFIASFPTVVIRAEYFDTAAADNAAELNGFDAWVGLSTHTIPFTILI